MSYNLIIEDSDIIDTNNNIDVNNYLFHLLETADNLNNFCNGCVELLNKYIKVKNFIIFKNISSNIEEIETLYEKNSHDTKKHKYHLIKQIITPEFYISNKSNVCYIDFSNQEENKNYKNIYIFPLNFKHNCLGYLSLEIELEKKYHLNIPEQINIVTHYISLYLYYQTLEKKQKKLKEEEEKFKENQQHQSEYLSHINHELRTPIAAVIGFSKMLQQRLYGELNPKQAQYIDAIYQSGTYLLELVSDFLDITKIQAEKEELFIEKILVNDLCESSLALVKTKAEEQNINLYLEINSSIEYCFADQRRIKQILVNLLSNAVKFTEKGSVSLLVNNTKNSILFKVIDTGIGIDKESQEKLFKPFSQIHNHLQNKHRGSGLGLAISLELARLHGGDITLKSEINKGSCFTLSLPLKMQ